MFKFLEHESEIGVEACNSSLEGLFVESSKALFSIMTDINKVECKNYFSVKVDAFNIEELLIELLNELVFLMNVNFSFFSKFEYKIFKKKVDGKEKFFLEGKVCGENIDENKHVLHVEVKAATYNGLKFFKKNNNYCIIFVVDI